MGGVEEVEDRDESYSSGGSLSVDGHLPQRSRLGDLFFPVNSIFCFFLPGHLVRGSRVSLLSDTLLEVKFLRNPRSGTPKVNSFKTLASGLKGLSPFGEAPPRSPPLGWSVATPKDVPQVPFVEVKGGSSGDRGVLRVPLRTPTGRTSKEGSVSGSKVSLSDAGPEVGGTRPQGPGRARVGVCARGVGGTS